MCHILYTIPVPNVIFFTVFASLKQLNNKPISFVLEQPFTPSIQSVILNAPFTVSARSFLSINEIVSAERMYSWSQPLKSNVYLYHQHQGSVRIEPSSCPTTSNSLVSVSISAPLSPPPISADGAANLDPFPMCANRSTRFVPSVLVATVLNNVLSPPPVNVLTVVYPI